jgi:hypothetical protein
MDTEYYSPIFNATGMSMDVDTRHPLGLPLRKQFTPPLPNIPEDNEEEHEREQEQEQEHNQEHDNEEHYFIAVFPSTPFQMQEQFSSPPPIRRKMVRHVSRNYMEEENLLFEDLQREDLQEVSPYACRNLLKELNEAEKEWQKSAIIRMMRSVLSQRHACSGELGADYSC